MARAINVKILGDSKDVERAFARASASAKVFGKTTDQLGTRLDKTTRGFKSLSVGAGLAGGLFAGAALTGLKQVTDAAAHSQQVLGQTKVALEDSGLSWNKYGHSIEAAAKSLTRLGFDDEETLQAISTFARRTGNVNKAIRDTALAADVARARYISLSAASNIVLKASLGQAGALRRIGIEAKTGATGYQLLTLLTQKYGGSAQAAANDATTANERLHVSIQNLEESLGKGLLPVLTQVVNQINKGVEAATIYGEALKKLGVSSHGVGTAIKAAFLASPGIGVQIAGVKLLTSLFGDHKKAIDNSAAAVTELGVSWEKVVRKIVTGLKAAEAASKGVKAPPPPAFGEPGFKPSKETSITTKLSTRLQSKGLDAQLTTSVADDLKVLAEQRKFLENALKDVRLKPGQVVSLKQDLVGVANAVTSINEGIAADARTKADAVKSAAAKAREAHKKAMAKAAKAHADFVKRMTEQADKLKSATLAALDRVQSSRDTARGLEDAQTALAAAIRQGGAGGIKEATRGLQDARVARARFIAEGARVVPTHRAGRTGAIVGQTVIINGNISLPNVKTPKQFLAEVNKIARGGASSQRGRNPGQLTGLG